MTENQKKIWITGASSGIGKAVAEKFAKEGWKVAVSARRKEILDKISNDQNIYSFPLDVTDEKNCRMTFEKIKEKLSRLTTNEVNLNIKEVKKPETNAYLVAENIAQQLVKRISYRRAMKRAMQSCLRLGAKGIKVSISGRLGGNEIARTEWLRDGSIPSHTLRADIDYAEAEALTTYGIIGIKVWIYKGEVFAKEFSQETNKVISKEGK